MATISLENIPAGEIKRAPHNTNYGLIQAAVNGLDGTNFGAGALAATHIFRARVSGDADQRLAIQADGKLVWGSGAAVGDVTLSRSAADVLALASGDRLDGVVAGYAAYRAITEIDVVNTVVETTVLSQAIAAGIMSTDRALRVTLVGDYLNNSGANRTVRVRVKLGATTLHDSTTASFAVDANRRPVFLQFTLGNLTASSQLLRGFLKVGYFGPPTTGIGILNASDGGAGVDATFGGTSAIDTTAAATLVVTVEHSLAHASLSFRRQYATIEVV